MVARKPWRESEHPRDPDGEFRNKGTGWVGRIVDQMRGGSHYRRVEGTDITDRVAPHARSVLATTWDDDGPEYEQMGGDALLREIGRMQGWDAAPAVGTSEQLDQAVADGGVEIWRGLQGDFPRLWEYGSEEGTLSNPGWEENSVGRYLAEMQAGGAVYYGTGIYANGVYTTVDRRTALRFAAGSYTPPEEWAQHAREKGGGVVRMVLSPDARILDYDPDAMLDLWDAFEDLRFEADDPADEDVALGSSEYHPSGRDEDSLMAEWRRRLSTERGLVAAMLGYDAIHIRSSVEDDDGGVGADQYIVLNPTALLIQDTLADL